MSKNMKTLTLIFAVLLIGIAGCKKDESTEKENFITTPAKRYQIKFTGTYENFQAVITGYRDTTKYFANSQHDTTIMFNSDGSGSGWCLKYVEQGYDLPYTYQTDILTKVHHYDHMLCNMKATDSYFIELWDRDQLVKMVGPITKNTPDTAITFK